ncbi:MAG TPA: PrsW family glutamic-type intramembrane protease, partial [Cytophagaceae bacterium]
MIFILLALAIAPGLAICVYIFFKDKFEKEPLHVLAKCFFLGVFSALPALGLGELADYFFPITNTSASIALDAFVYIAFMEEFCKYAVLRGYAYNKPSFNEPYDGIMYSVMIAMGFATIENIIYVLENGLLVAIVRMLTAVPAHATFGILMGYYVGLAKFKSGNKLPYLLLGLFSAIFLHGIYDFCLIMYVDKYQFLLFGALLSLISGLFLSKKAIALHNQNSPFKPNEVQTTKQPLS